MKVLVCGPRDFDDYEVVKKAIESSGFDITEIVHGDAKGVDSLAEQWAEENGIPYTKFPAKWRDLTLPGAVVKQNKFGPYNATAGFHRNQLMVDYCDGVIAIDMGTNGTGDTIKRTKEAGKPLHLYDPRCASEEDVDYVF